MEDTSVQRNLNMLRKLSLNLIRLFKERAQSKKAFSRYYSQPKKGRVQTDPT